MKLRMKGATSSLSTAQKKEESPCHIQFATSPLARLEASKNRPTSG